MTAKCHHDITGMLAAWNDGSAEQNRNLLPVRQTGDAIGKNGLHPGDIGTKRREAVIYEASRLESLLFSGYDPHFKGDEPPGLYKGQREVGSCGIFECPLAVGEPLA